MNKKYKIFIIIGILLYAVYHIATLIYSPIPWFDEVTYANITESFIKNGHFYEAARNISSKTSKLDLAYGPVYFMLQAAVTKMFGFTVFTFRMTNMLFGFAVLFLLYKVCRRLRFNDQVTMVVMLLICFDPQFNQFLHSGRMDFVALFFSLSAYLVFTSIGNDGANKYLAKGLFTGVLMACAFMTNPRILFSFSFYLFFFLYELVTGGFKNIKPVLLKNIAVAISFIGLYSVWVYVEFGGYGNYISETYTNSPIMKEHIGMTSAGLRLNYNMVMHILSVLCFLFLLFTKKVKENIHVVLFAVPPVLVFLFLVSGGIAGRYYGLVVPFTTIIVVGATLHVYHNLFSKIFTRTLLAMFLVIFIFKAAYILGGIDQRDPAYYDKAISAYVPAKASVAGDFAYYYIGKSHDWTFQCLEENGTMREKETYFLTNKYDYFIISKNNVFKPLYDTTFLKNRYKLIATIDDKASNDFFHNIIGKLPYRITEGYSCYIYQYIGG